MIVEDNGVSGGKIDTQTTSTSTEQEYEDLGPVKIRSVYKSPETNKLPTWSAIP